MHKYVALLLAALIAACGMKGDLSEPEQPGERVDDPAAERKTIPATPDPSTSR